MKMKLTYKEVTAVTSEVKAVVNSRSLTYIQEDEVEEVLTPSHLYRRRRFLDEQNNESSYEDNTDRNKHCRKFSKKMETFE